MPLLPLVYEGPGGIAGRLCNDPKCQHKYTSVREAEKHMSSVHGINDGWSCSKCFKEFESASRVACHFARCSGSAPAAEVVKAHKCMECEASFDTKIGLGQHRRKAHPVVTDNCAPPLKNNRVSEELIDMLAQAEASISAPQARSINKDTQKALYRLYPLMAKTEVSIEKIKSIRNKQPHKEAYLKRLNHHRSCGLAVQEWASGLPNPPMTMSAPWQPSSLEEEGATGGPETEFPLEQPNPNTDGAEKPHQQEGEEDGGNSEEGPVLGNPDLSVAATSPEEAPLQVGKESNKGPTREYPPVQPNQNGGGIEESPLQEGMETDGVPEEEPLLVELVPNIMPTTSGDDGVASNNTPPTTPRTQTTPGSPVVPQGANAPDDPGGGDDPQPVQPLPEVAAANGDEDEPGRRTPNHPGGGRGGGSPPHPGPASSNEQAQDDPLTEAVKSKLRCILRTNTNNPLVKDLNTVAEEALLVVEWSAEVKQQVFGRVEEVLRKHRPKVWEEPPPRTNPPRQQANIPFTGNRAARRKHRYARAQRLFQRKPKELLRPDCLEEGRQEGAYSPSSEEAFETYNGRFGVPSKEEESEAPPVGNHDIDLVWAPLSKKEIEIALRSMPNSAGGPVFSKLNKAALKSIGSQALHRIFLIWQLARDIPGWCKDNRTILIPKKTSPGSINDFRPLTIGSHISRLFTRAFAGRLTHNLPLHHRQKAFRPVDGCGENLALIEGIIADARKRNTPLYITFVDVAKAFDTVSHHSIERALRRLRCPKPFVDLVRNLYTGAQTRIQVDGVHTEPICITNGVKQGCPLSPLLFNSVTDELLHLIGDEGGYKLPNGDRIASMAFADDLILISSSREGMIRTLRTMDLFFQARGMKVQPPKCCTIGLQKRRGGGLMTDKTPFSLMDPTTRETRNMRVMGPADWTSYLGLEIGSAGLKSGRQLREESIRSLKQELTHLHRLPLKANQKVHLLRTYVIPGLQYKWTKGPAALNMLREADRLIADKVRTWLKIFPSTPMAFFRVPVSDGGLGIPSVQDLVTTGKARLHAKLCGSADSAVAYAAKNLLWGKEVTSYARRLDGFHLGGLSSGSDLSRKVKDGHRRTLQSSTHGRGAETFRDDPLGNSVLNDVTAKTGFVMDMVKLRTQSFPVRMSIRPTQRGNPVPYNTTCRVPECTRDESLSHVLQECPAVHGLRVKRHEVVDQQCTKWITDKGFRTLKEPHIVSRVDGNIYKPDRLFAGPGSDTLYVVDWTCPYETSRASMKAAEWAKVEKYGPHKDSILEKAHQAFPGQIFNTVIVKGVAFGARGAILPTTREFLHKKLGMSKRCVSWVQHRVIQKSISMTKCFFAGNRG